MFREIYIYIYDDMMLLQILHNIFFVIEKSFAILTEMKIRLLFILYQR